MTITARRLGQRSRANICDKLTIHIEGVEGEFYPCKPDIFHKTYEVIDA